MATEQSGPPLASGRMHGAVASMCFLRGHDGSLGDAILKVGIDPTEGELLPRVVACLSEGVVMKTSIVAVVMGDLDSMLCSILLEGKLGGESFVGLVVELDVDKLKAAEVVNKNSGTLVALLGKFALQLCIKIYLP
jgi:hypothetical protein